MRGLSNVVNESFTVLTIWIKPIPQIFYEYELEQYVAMYKTMVKYELKIFSIVYQNNESIGICIKYWWQITFQVTGTY